MENGPQLMDELRDYSVVIFAIIPYRLSGLAGSWFHYVCVHQPPSLCCTLRSKNLATNKSVAKNTRCSISAGKT